GARGATRPCGSADAGDAPRARAPRTARTVGSPVATPHAPEHSSTPTFSPASSLSGKFRTVGPFSSCPVHDHVTLSPVWGPQSCPRAGGTVEAWREWSTFPSSDDDGGSVRRNKR